MRTIGGPETLAPCGRGSLREAKRGEGSVSADRREAYARTSESIVKKRKGLQLALEPLNGQGIAGYVPEPEFWVRHPEAPHPAENLHIVSALGVLGEVETLALHFEGGAR